MARQAKDSDDENEYPEQIVEKSRKRKRGNEETEIGKQKASDWVYDMDYITWRDKLHIETSLEIEVLISGIPLSKS